MSEPRASTRFIFGCLGGMLLVAVNFISSGPSLAFDATPIYLAGYALRSLLLIILGGVGTLLFANNVDDRRLLIQLGISLPALLLAALPSPTTVTRLPNISSLFASPAYAQAPRKADVPASRTESSAELVRGITGSPNSTTPPTEQESRFRMIFFSVLSLTIFSAVANLFLVTNQNASRRVDSAIEGFSTTWKLGFGAIVGLVSGKAL